MQLDENEYTISSLIDYLENKYGNKITGKSFNSSDIAQYCMRGYIPFRYGGNKLTFKYIKGVKVITIGESEIKIKKDE